ncbi:hypothetical protein SAMN05444349_103139 [Bacteroides faecichinchillae]|uniref:Uncharacterized protein n=1 Tax=Bacteroides faecichinchillae TaxID=871325 RepID=A0A1M4UGF3_9BACE|nr:hypothetical protein SAMN05444349_103139 [Bacteroides faecichinchillae]
MLRTYSLIYFNYLEISSLFIVIASSKYFIYKHSIYTLKAYFSKGLIEKVVSLPKYAFLGNDLKELPFYHFSPIKQKYIKSKGYPYPT